VPERTSIPELIDDATELIRIGWDVGALAKDANGNTCQPESDGACKWCEWGAVLAVTRGRELPDTVANYINDLINMANPGKRRDQYNQKEGDQYVTFGWNDGKSTHEQVTERFENARRFVRENPQLAVVPKYNVRSFVHDD
jgi:hypothetical protein